MTAHAIKGDQERCLQAGMDGYVSKPIRIAELFETIDDVMDACESLSAGPSLHQPDCQTR